MTFEISRSVKFALGLGLMAALTLLLVGASPAYAQADPGWTTELAVLPDEAATTPEAVTLPADVPADWWATVQEDIRRSEYHVTWQEQTYLAGVDAAYQAPNRAHNLRTYFTPAGIRVIPRVCQNETCSPLDWEWSLALTGYGYAGAVQPVGAAELVASGNRIEYRRAGLVEWYVNDEAGLEQGFTLATRPAGARWNAPLQVEMALGDDLAARLTDDGTMVEFTSLDGSRTLYYGGLHVADVTGRQFPARLALSDATLSILVDAVGAVYPLTIDPTVTGLSTSANWTAESNQAGAEFGWSVSTAGDVDGDGYSDVIVGAPYYDNGQTNEGRTYVYHGTDEGLSTTADWTAESNQAGAEFGASVSVAGDVDGDGYSDVIVGAPYYDNGQTNEGRAYVYHGTDEGLSTTEGWTAESNQADAEFGTSVGTAGDVDINGYSDVIVGAPKYDNSQTDEGGAFVWHGSSTGLGSSGTPANANWTAESNQNYAYFGTSVSTAGDVSGDGYSDVIVGAPKYDNGQTDEGRAYVFVGTENGLRTTVDWTAESNQAGAEFGTSVGPAGDVDGDGYADVIVGAPMYDNTASTDGRAYVYHGSSSGLSTTADWTAESNQADAEFGNSVGTAGDVNGDGYSDVIVGAPGYSNSQSGEGAAYVYHGAENGLSTTAGWTQSGANTDDNFGYSVATAGDVDGDGYADVIVGAPFYDDDVGDTKGRAYVYYGSSTGLSTSNPSELVGSQNTKYFGYSVATAGDVNGDGYSDVIVGEYGANKAYVYHGSSSGLNTTASTTLTGPAYSNFGHSVNTAGNVNGDEYADVIVGARNYNPGGAASTGAAYVYLGTENGVDTTYHWMAEGEYQYDYFGYSVATAGDVDRNGCSDVIVGARNHDNGQTDEGRAYVYHGSSSGLSASANWTAESNQEDAGPGFELGTSVSTAGDVNGDGYADVIVSFPMYDTSETNEGVAFVWLGSSTGLGADGTPSNADWTAESDQANAYFGTSVGTAGDVDGDGYADVIVGAPNDDEGQAYTYYGNGGGGLHFLPRQLRTSTVVNIAPLGMSDSYESVRLSLIARMPLGGEQVKLHWQVADLGTSFDDPGVIEGTSTSWTSVGTGDTNITETITGLDDESPYHWRVRLLYRPGNRLGQPASRWFHIPWNGWNEQDFRTAEIE